MQTVELVVHCYRYARVFTYQLSSLILYPPKRVSVLVHVYYCEEDKTTIDLLKFFAKRLPENVTPFWTAIPKEKLLRRAIGRNMAALATEADVCWFCDADYVFGEGALDTLADIDFTTHKLYYPKHCQISRTNPLGHEYSMRINEPQIVDIDPKDFKGKWVFYAIGGLQIVPGDVAREYGYCRHWRRYQRPVKGDTFLDTRCDIGFRKDLAAAGDSVLAQAFEMPNLFRIRELKFGVCDQPPPAP